MECNDCANGAAMAWPELYQEYVLMAENIQDRAYYQSKDEKWALSWSSSGWGLGAADQLGKKTQKYTPICFICVLTIYQFLGSGWAWSGVNVSCPSDVGYNNWIYYDTTTNEFKNAEDTLAISCISNECCLDCTDFPNDTPPYDGTVWEIDVITEKGKIPVTRIYCKNKALIDSVWIFEQFQDLFSSF